MSKHTPGPWRHSYKTARTNNIGVYDKSGVLIASIDTSIFASHLTVSRREQDARLVAAAPELLAALVSVTDEMSRLPASLGYEYTHLRDARAAIARATGDTA